MNKPLIIITGASSGMGAEMAKLFSAAGHPVGLLARNKEAMEKLNRNYSALFTNQPIKSGISPRNSILSASGIPMPCFRQVEI